MDGAVAHQNQGISFFYPETVLVDLLVLNYTDILGNRNQFSGTDKDTARIVKFHQIGVSVMEYLQDTEGRICHLPHLADRERLHDRLHAFLQSRAV